MNSVYKVNGVSGHSIHTELKKLVVGAYVVCLYGAQEIHTLVVPPENDNVSVTLCHYNDLDIGLILLLHRQKRHQVTLFIQ